MSARISLRSWTCATVRSYNGRISDDLTYDDLSCFRSVNSSLIRRRESRIGCSRESSGSGRLGVSMLAYDVAVAGGLVIVREPKFVVFEDKVSE